MGLIVNGKWQDKWYDTKSTDGKFKRQDSMFRHWLTADGEPINGKKTFKTEKGRYHLYVSHACPWAHRTLIFRSLKQLEDYIDVTVVDPLMLENGWEVEDPLYQCKYMYELYLKADNTYEGRVTVPVLWDKKTETIVNNESSDIIRMFNSAFNHLTGNQEDYYPSSLHQKIHDINDKVYHGINNGVYKSGFATTQAAYEEAVDTLFDTLDWAEEILQNNTYLTGETLTEADWRLFTTLVRFDPVYVGHFKTNKKMIADYPALFNYLKALYQYKEVADTVHFDHIKGHYYKSHKTINPTGVVPKGPIQDLNAPHNRH